MKYTFLLLLFFLISCNTVKFQKMGDDANKELKGKVKSIEITMFSFKSGVDDTVGKINIRRKFYFDKNNKVLKEQYSTNYDSEEILFYYNANKLLLSTLTKQNSDSTYFIDKFEYDNIIVVFLSKFDKKNNVIEEKNENLLNKRNNWKTKYSYDYKKRICLLKSYNDVNIENNTILEFHYDRKGRIMNINSINSIKNRYSYTSFKFDKFGNSINRKILDANKNDTGSSIYKNTYDKKGNIIQRETYKDAKLIEKSIIDILY
jgi:hypothetical protein